VSEVDVTGCLLRTFTDVRAPRHLSVDSEGRVLVADSYNDRILLLNSELQLQRVLIDTDSQVKLLWPTRLCYDELRSQLYVAHDRYSEDSSSSNSEDDDAHERYSEDSSSSSSEDGDEDDSLPDGFVSVFRLH